MDAARWHYSSLILLAAFSACTFTLGLAPHGLRRVVLATTSSIVATFKGISPRSPELSEALGEIVTACLDEQLGALPAIVVAVATGRPGAGYYPIAHPKAQTEEEKLTAWQQELKRVKRTNYPFSL